MLTSALNVGRIHETASHFENATAGSADSCLHSVVSAAPLVKMRLLRPRGYLLVSTMIGNSVDDTLAKTDKTGDCLSTFGRCLGLFE